MNKNTYKDGIRVGDYPIFCDCCGMKCWYSQSTTLDKNTGYGGSIRCPNCVDGIYWGIVPYTVEPEKSIPQSTTDGYSDPTTSLPAAPQLDFTKCPPRSS